MWNLLIHLGLLSLLRKIKTHGLDERRIAWCHKRRISGELKMYDAESHWHMFYLPKNIRDAIDEPGPILDEEHPIY